MRYSLICQAGKLILPYYKVSVSKKEDNVNSHNVSCTWKPLSQIRTVIMCMLLWTDIDECLENNGGCDKNADCKNVAGGFICTCKTGFSGDGQTCNGRYISAIVTYINLMFRLYFDCQLSSIFIYNACCLILPTTSVL